MFDRWTIRDHDPDGALGGAQHNIEHFMHDGEETIFHGVANNVPTRWMMYGPLPGMVVIDARNVLSVPLGDHLNTIRDVVDTSGTIINHLTIDSFGRRLLTADPFVRIVGHLVFDLFNLGGGRRRPWHCELVTVHGDCQSLVRHVQNQLWHLFRQLIEQRRNRAVDVVGEELPERRPGGGLEVLPGLRAGVDLAAIVAKRRSEFG